MARHGASTTRRAIAPVFLLSPGIDAEGQEVTSALKGNCVDQGRPSPGGFSAGDRKRQGSRTTKLHIFLSPLSEQRSGDLGFILTTYSFARRMSPSWATPYPFTLSYFASHHVRLACSCSLCPVPHNAEVRHLSGTHAPPSSTCIIFHGSPTYTLR